MNAGHAPPPPSSFGRGVKNFRKVFAGRGGGQKFFFFRGVGVGGGERGEPRNFEVKIKTA